MAETAPLENRRILLIDDNPAIHADFRKILCADEGDSAKEDDFEAMESAVFGKASSARPHAAAHFELDDAFQGAEGFAKVQKAAAEGKPYALAFVDVRMPPGWDGIETLEHLFEVDSDLQTVICSAYSDVPWEKLHERLKHTDRYLILKKPFEAIEVRQMAMALTRKWEREVALRASENKNRALLDALPDAVLRIDREGSILERRAATESMAALGHTENLLSLVPKHDAERLRRVLSDAIDKDTPGTFELHLREQGEDRICEMRVAGSGRSEAVVILRDTTETWRALEEEAGRRERELKLYAQMEALAALSVPLIPVADHVLVMPLVGELDARRGQRMRETLLEAVAARGARTAILDVTGVPRFDQGATEEIVRAAQAVRLVGARFVLTGLGPETARQLVTLGLDLKGIKTSRTLQAEIEHALIRR